MDIFTNLNDLETQLLVYLFVINMLSFLLFAIDKRKSIKKKHRIPEWILLFVSFIGGSTGGLISMVIFKHKLYKRKFSIGIPTFIIINKFLEIMVFNYNRIK